jgi:isopentenyl-diphosphate delta-isomerase
MVDAMRQEHVILVNEQGQPLALRKYAAHTATTPLHLAFSAGYLTSRANVWSPAARCKKPGPASGPTPFAATRSRVKRPKPIIRRCRFELGADIDSLTPCMPIAIETDPSGIVENEICPVFAAHIISPLQINADEVMDYQWRS